MDDKLKKVDIIASIDNLSGNSVNEKYENLYKAIGKYFIANADRMSKDMCFNNRCLNISIDIVPGELITIDRKTSEFLMEVDYE
ncbi:hypothetical protein C672_1717 [[Clostridium] bifermentans ATCC 638]|uniref:Uncharacterized protein n=1 Tax=Paraclostridium bifermentans ATCC 638 = DSM 14991 TaxID=1233171 RepID=T4VMQ8_PARBF|nr:hypothetical protein [Paraclostridium bifermentans]EQK42773.1 hypothetical protein C672_1717 [[Clostridium] bifermentans ATCC 638] [Paraclostridium bifermentans ATCC 638 = DSM 14991]RIZ58452.1 hypothetical protein CHH45_11545 [Paraclostridium bifermentans]UAG19571.1 hypothetical protein KXZ80_07635 [Paraclostridium bifermentans]